MRPFAIFILGDSQPCTCDHPDSFWLADEIGCAGWDG